MWKVLSNKKMLDFSKLGEDFFSQVETQPLKNPFLIHTNQSLQTELGLQMSNDDLLDIASGNKPFQQIKPIASIYAGHQFGYFVPQLGDGRSCLIGQTQGQELSLKGAGKTPYSRSGDGRAVLRSSIREYLCSIAMQGLGIATTQALTLVGSQSEVYREQIETGAIVLRTAPSHIRFGNFELFASRGQVKQVKLLADFVIEHYYPQCSGKNRYADFLLEVVKRTAIMIANWQAQGFSHGVMNTDNMSILGLTLDYGPFGFLETYNPQLICNHSDHEGRYSFDQQPSIGLWNLARLADSLSSLIDAKQAKSVLAHYQPHLVTNYSQIMRQKFGLLEKHDEDNVLITEFFEVLYRHKKDYSNSLRKLSDLENFSADGDFSKWLERYNKRISEEKNHDRIAMMNRINPSVILRNYLAEKAIRSAEDDKDYTEIGVLFKLLSKPFDAHSKFESYRIDTPNWAGNLSVSCSS
ncbi:Selenoprotein O and cysteine-containing homologs [uncultured Candidatus Thioglobus sp.]|nr:Selenoprotein O and cysteine-containing homologs [uncultured Candidatus Thioglobus sp.]SMN00472.1 Selenoprotein O and cysteine-containing homologs [uncultured Candidatus Thioglobus sp.]